MQTKLNVLCDRLLEAGWLVALLVEPLFFNVYSSRVFEPDKITLLRSIALVMIGVWLIKLLEAGGQLATSGEGENVSLWQRIRRTPLAVPVLALVLVYLLATVTSLVPSTSLWGSYQRLQGTYSFLSYVLIFALVLSTLRRKEQLERLVLIAILVSLPISLYGLVQHYRLDPLPWGGDVTVRVASNMGNSIFVAAFLIMVVPLTLRNLLEALSGVLSDEERAFQVIFVGGYLLAVGVLIVAWGMIGFMAGLLMALVLTFALGLFAISMHKPVVRFFWVGAYSVILVAQLICIFFTQSRGPWLGLLAGVFFFVLAYAFARRIRWLQWAAIAMAIAGTLFLVLLNVPNTPLERVKTLPYIGRLGRVFETDRGTGKVRVLIWEGVVELIGFHEPIGLPGQEDPLNALRPFIGYGPEAMYVAYNPFYPPDLAHYERRNASPDRSHNETFDALVQTGLIGFVVYLGLFASIFYYSLKWLGLIENRLERNLFVGLGLGGATLGFLVPVLLEGSLEFIGVGIPFGFIVGLGVYLVVSSFISSRREVAGDGRQLLLIALLSAIVAHFVEIHFGIAIAATRTYFWAYAGLLVVLGMNWVHLAADVPVPEAQSAALAALEAPARHSTKSASAARRRRARRKSTPAALPVAASSTASRWSSLITYALLVGLLLITLAYDFTTNQSGATSAWQILSDSFTGLVRDATVVRSYGLLALVLFTWLIGGVLALTQVPVSDETDTGASALRTYATALGIYAAITILAFFLFAVPHAARLRPGADVAMLITPYYVAMFLMLFAVAVALWWETPLPTAFVRPAARWLHVVAVPVIAGLVLFVLVKTNLDVVKADIYYKQGKHYESQQAWDYAINRYQQAISYAPNQDFYYLFLGRAYLEKAGTISDAGQRQPWLEMSQRLLEEARRLNPLNTDHTANLARLYRSRAELESDPAERARLLQQASQYYQEATTLSPNSAQLYNEWGIIYALMGDLDTAMAKYQFSLALDAKFDQTYLYLGNLYLNQKEYDKAAEAYKQALEINPKLVQAHSALGYVYSQQGKLEEAVQENLAVLELSPQDYASVKNLAILYQQMGRLAEALEAAKAALQNAPASDQTALQSFISQLESRLNSGGG